MAVIRVYYHLAYYCLKIAYKSEEITFILLVIYSEPLLQ